MWRFSFFVSAARAFRVRRASWLGFLLKSIFLCVGARGTLAVFFVSAVDLFRFRGACVSGSARPQVRIVVEIGFPWRWSAWCLASGFRVSRFGLERAAPSYFRARESGESGEGGVGGLLMCECSGVKEGGRAHGGGGPFD